MDQTQSALVLARGIREAYSDLFQINTQASNLSVNEVKNKMKTLSAGQFTDRVLQQMAGTFKALCQAADFTASANAFELESSFDEHPTISFEAAPRPTVEYTPTSRIG